MDSKNKLKDMFFQDAAEFIGELQNSVQELSGEAPDKNHLDRAFRAAHSIKSESSYLNLTDITEQANIVENLLESLKQDHPAGGAGGELIGEIEKLSILVEREQTKPSPIDGEREDGEKEASVGFTDFEMELVREAEARGETLYRLYCEIDPSEQMIYPRLFLLINNLELEVNVIKTIPQIDENMEPEKEIQIFFSSPLGKKEIYRIISIDQIARVQLSSLDYSALPHSTGLLPGRKQLAEGEHAAPSLLRVDAGKFEELKTGIEEIEFFSRDLIRKSDDADSDQFRQLTQIMDLTGHIGKAMQRLYLISLENELLRLKEYALQLAEKLDKQVDVVISGGDFEIDTRFLDILSDVLVHIVRNAVDHGIEESAERELLQKPARGKLVLAGFVDENDAYIQVIDDGRGIEAEEIYEHSGETDADLLELLSRPGFTTRSFASNDSGRGYGLNIAVTKLRQIPNADLRMVSKPGQGTVFTISMTAGYTNVMIVVTKHSDRQICFQKKYVVSMGEIDGARYSRDEQGRLLYKGKPVFTEHGSINTLSSLPVERFAVELSYLDRGGFVLVDEIMFEKEIFDKQINRDVETEPHLFTIDIAGKDKNFYLVSPSIILNA